MLTEEDIKQIELDEMKNEVKHFKKRYEDLQNDYYDLIRRYEELYKSQELQKENYGQFPILVIAKDNITTKYNSNNFDCIYTDLEYSTISTLLL